MRQIFINFHALGGCVPNENNHKNVFGNNFKNNYICRCVRFLMFFSALRRKALLLMKIIRKNFIKTLQ